MKISFYFLQFLNKLEEDGKVFIFRPQNLMGVGRTTKDSKKLEKLFNQGHSIVKKRIDNLMEWMNEG